MTKLQRIYSISGLLYFAFLFSACSGSDGENPAEESIVEAEEKVFTIDIVSPKHGEIIKTLPVRVVGEVRNEQLITYLEISGVEQDVTAQVLVEGDGDEIKDQYVLAFDASFFQANITQVISGLDSSEGLFDPGSNRLVVRAVDGSSHQSVSSRMFAVGEVTSLSRATGMQIKAVTKEASPGESDVKNAIVLGLEASELNTKLKEYCAQATPVINDLIKTNLGEYYKNNPIPSYTPVLNNPTNCDPTFNFDINPATVEIGAMNCSAEFESGLLTLSIKPQIRSLEVSASGECGLCIDIGDTTLSSVAASINLRVGVDLPAIRISLRDWSNTLPIDENDPAYIRFIEDSLTTPAIERARIIEASIKDYTTNPLSEFLNNLIVEHITGAQEFENQIGYALDPTSEIVEDARSWLTELISEELVRPADSWLTKTKVCSNDLVTSCQNNSDCIEAGICESALSKVRQLAALDSFATNADGITLAVKGNLSPSNIDPTIELTPGIVNTPAVAPVIGEPGAKNNFVVIADDTFNQVFASLTEAGDFIQQCQSPPEGSGVPETLGDMDAYCGGDSTCVAMTGGDCDSLLTPVDIGACHGARGDLCSPVPANPLDPGYAEAEACNRTPNVHLTPAMPLLYCSQIDVPPSFWIQDDINAANESVNTPNEIESIVRLNDVYLGIVVDRSNDGVSDNPKTLDDCSDPNGNVNSACLLSASCLDVDINSNISLLTSDTGTTLNTNLSGIKNKTTGMVCGGSNNYLANNPLSNVANVIFDQLIMTLNTELEANAFEPHKGLDVPLTNPSLVALKTTGAQPGFDDYIGLTAEPTVNVCGNGVCDPEEACGYGAGSCVQDCGLCGIDKACESQGDCETGLCVLNVCVSSASAEIKNASCDDTCLIGTDCPGGVCNFGVCTKANSLPALWPCSTGEACENGSCNNGICEQICGDTFCDGTEQRGETDTFPVCNADCGKKRNGDVCGFDASCESGLCDGTCVVPGSVQNGEYCLKDTACASGVCNALTCVAANSVEYLEPCTRNDACRSGECGGGLLNAGLCTAVCGDGVCDSPSEACGKDDNAAIDSSCRTDCGQCEDGVGCFENETCQSGFCSAFTCSQKKVNGDSCALDSSCASGYCNSVLKCADKAGIGGSCGTSTDCTSGLYCSGFACTDKKPNGEGCLSGSSCQSGYCSFATCTAKKAAGESCLTDNSCSSGSCTLSGLSGLTCD